MINNDVADKIASASTTLESAIPVLTTIATALGLVVAPEFALAAGAIAVIRSLVGEIRKVDVDSLKPGMAAATAAAAQLELNLK